MYYGTGMEFNTSSLNEEQIVQLIEEKGLYSTFGLSENIAGKGLPDYKMANWPYENTETTVKSYVVEMYGKEIGIKVFNSHINQIRVLNGDYVAIRANKKKGIPSTRFKDLLTEEMVEEIKAIRRKEVLKNCAKAIVERRKYYTEEIKEKLEAVERQISYEKLPKEEQTQFLIDNGYVGIENLGVFEERPDGFGHTTGVATMINHENKTIGVVGFSSDD